MGRDAGMTDCPPEPTAKYPGGRLGLGASEQLPGTFMSGYPLLTKLGGRATVNRVAASGRSAQIAYCGVQVPGKPNGGLDQPKLNPRLCPRVRILARGRVPRVFQVSRKPPRTSGDRRHLGTTS